MAGKYRALRVPIALLHQRVYPTSARLPPMVHMEFPAKPEKPDAGRVISPGARGIRESTTLFDVQPALRRFFFLVDGAFRSGCRGCGTICPDQAARTDHTKCYFAVSQTILKLLKEQKCVICEDFFAQTWTTELYNGIPVCSQMCLNVWDNMNPDVFELMYADVLAGIDATR